MTRTVPGSGAVIKPIFDELFGVRAVEVINGGSLYDPSDPPRLTVDGCGTPDTEAILYPIIDSDSGRITHVRVLERGKGYDPLRLQITPEQDTPSVITSFDINKVWQSHPNSPTSGVFGLDNQNQKIDRLTLTSDNHPKPSQIYDSERQPGGSGDVVDRTYSQEYIYRGGKDVPNTGTRLFRPNTVNGIMANGVLLHTPDWGQVGGADINFPIDTVKYDYVKNANVYDGVLDNNTYYYHSSKVIDEFELTNGVFENGNLERFTWKVKVETGSNIVLEVTNVDETLGNVEVGRIVDEIGGNAKGEVSKIVRNNQGVVTRVYLREITGDAFLDQDLCIGANGFTFKINADPININPYYIEFGPSANKFGPFSPGVFYFAPQDIKVQANQMIIFDQSDISNQSNNHSIRLSTVPDGTLNGGTLYLNSTGASGAIAADYENIYQAVFIMNSDETSRIYFHCVNHRYMGGYAGDEAYMVITPSSPRTNNQNTYYVENFFQATTDPTTVDYSRHVDGHSKILGMSFDGYPIYGPFGYTNPNGLTVTYSVKVDLKDQYHPFWQQGSAKGYYLIGGQYKNVTQAPVLTFVRGATYKFEQNDASNTTHAIYFSENSAAYAGQDRYETGVVYTLDGSNVDYATYAAGFPTATNRSVSITLAENSPNTLYYACQAHGYMGASINITNNTGVVVRETSSYRTRVTAELQGARQPVNTTGTVTYNVAISNGQYTFNGSRPPFLDLDRGKKYIFNLDDSSNSSSGANMLLISETEDGWHSVGASEIGNASYLYTGQGIKYFINGSEVTYQSYLSGFQGATSRKVEFEIPVDAPRILYLFGYSTSGLWIRVVNDGYLIGDLTSDYIYDSIVGTLDEYNGKFASTPEYPNGTYAYFMTEDSNGNPAYPYAIAPKMYSVPVDEGDLLPSQNEVFPTIAEGDVVLNTNGSVAYVKMTKKGDNYFGPAKAKILGGEGTGALASPVVQTVTGLSLINPGRSYATPPTLIFEGGGGGTGAQGAAEIDTLGKVTSINVANPGEFYQEPPFVLITGGGGIGAKATAQISQGQITGITVTDPGSGYVNPPNIIFTKLVNLKRKTDARQAFNSEQIFLTGLVKNLNASDTTVYVDSTDGFPGSGNLIIDTETVSYTGKSEGRFTGLTRGVNFNYDQRVILDTTQNDQNGVSTYKFNVGDRVIRRVENANNKVAKVYDWNPNTRELLVTFEVDELAFIDGGIPSTLDAIVQFDAGTAASAPSGKEPHIVLVSNGDTITLLTDPISTLNNRKFQDIAENDGAGDGIADLVNTDTEFANQINLDGGLYNSLYGIEETQGGTNTTLFQVGDNVKDATIPFKYASIISAGALADGVEHNGILNIYLDANVGNGQNYSVNDVVTGSVSNVQGTVVSWDPNTSLLVVNNVVPYNTTNINVGIGGFLYEFSSKGTIVDFIVQAPGTNYTAPPTIAIENTGDVQATATAVMTAAGDQVASINVVNGGYGIPQTVDGTYNIHPTITFTNAVGDTTGSGAVAQAILGGEDLIGNGGARYRIKRIEYATILRS